MRVTLNVYIALLTASKESTTVASLYDLPDLDGRHLRPVIWYFNEGSSRHNVDRFLLMKIPSSFPERNR